MATNLEELVVKISADTAELQRELRRAQSASERATSRMSRAFSGFGSTLRNVGRSVLNFRTGLLAAFGTAGIGLMVRNSVSAADSIGKVADKVGLTTDSLQELRFAADQAGVAQNTLDMAMQRFSRRVGEAVQGSGELKDTLAQYNIAVTNSDGSTRDLDAVLGDLANAMSQASSNSERLRIAFKAFDSEGAALVNLLRDGSVSLDEMRRRARELGIVLDESLIREAEKTADELSELDRQIKANITRFSVDFAPVLVGATELLVAFAGAAVRAKDALREFLLGLPTGTLSSIGVVEVEPEGPDETNIVLERRQRERQELVDEIKKLDDQIATLETGGRIDPLAGVFARSEDERADQNLEDLKARRLALEVELEEYQDVLDSIADAVTGMTGGIPPRAGPVDPGAAGPSGLLPDLAEAPEFSGRRGSFAPTSSPLDAPDVFAAAAAEAVDETQRLEAEIDGPLRDAMQGLVDDMREDFKSPFEVAIDEMEKWRLIMREGATDLTENDLQRIQDKINKDLADALGETAAASDQATTAMQRGFERVATTGVNRLISALQRGELSFQTFGEIALQVLADIASSLANFGAQSLGASIFGAVGSGVAGGVGAGFGGGAGLDLAPAAASSGNIFHSVFPREKGGGLGFGQLGLVGEKGPEFAIHRPSGTEIIPLNNRPSGAALSRMGGGGPQISLQQNFDFRGADKGTEIRLRRMIEEDRPRTIQAATAEVRRMTLAGGSFSRDMGKR